MSKQGLFTGTLVSIVMLIIGIILLNFSNVIIVGRIVTVIGAISLLSFLVALIGNSSNKDIVEYHRLKKKGKHNNT